MATGNSAEFGRSAGANVNVAIKSGCATCTAACTGMFAMTSSMRTSSSPTGRAAAKCRSGRTSTAFRSADLVVIPKLYNGRDKTFWFASWEGFGGAADRQRNRRCRLKPCATATSR